MKSALIVESDCWSDSVSGQVDEMDENVLVERLTRLESNVGHIQADVSDIKVELRRTNDRLDELIGEVRGTEKRLDGRIDGVQRQLDDKIDDVGKRLDDKIDGVEKRLDAKIDGVRESLTAKIDGVRDTLADKIDALRAEMASMKVWAIGLYVAMSGSLLFVMAKGFKWL